jgi:hypothetical protein
MSIESNEVKNIKQFLNSYDCGKSSDNNNKEIQTQEKDGFNSSDEIQPSVVMRNKSTSDSCAFGDHLIAANDVECEVFDWLYYHFEYKYVFQTISNNFIFYFIHYLLFFFLYVNY